MSANNEIPMNRKLSEIYSEGYDLYESFSTRLEPTNSLEFQLDIKKCIGLFEDSTRLVSLIGMFSSNEKYEEIPTNDLQYFLLPYFLGQLTLKLTTGSRSDIVSTAEVYYLDFLKRCDEYGFVEAGKSKALQKAKDSELQGSDSEFDLLTRAAADRNTKIIKYREKKLMDEQVASLKILMKRDHEDESTKREFYLTFLKACIIDVYDELSSLSTEKEMLEHIRKMQHDHPESENHQQRKRTHPPKPLKPIIITRDAAQKAIYGLGYPSMPTMTVAEFYDERVAEGIFPAQADNSLQRRTEQDQAEQDEKENEERDLMEDQDDERLRLRDQSMDDWKDDHRRGEGNRHNRS